MTGSSSLHGRFVPGTVLGGRYRVVGLIGRGGMGEVVRADDLKLDQPVALKFLPERVGEDPAHLARFLDEVRLARRVSHPGVCRVHDVGELDGLHFLSMEYVDGEDLASLLRRIGRLPRDKAIEIARQLCAGVAAAHEQGILHRDLKPANVMIDGRGKVRITDFGLAGLAADVRGKSDVVGTLAYMAPEQLAKGEFSVQSDLFSLGLVLHELFTGERVFKDLSAVELLRAHREWSPRPIGDHVDDSDPAVEEAVLRCLDPDPAERPPSALAVAAALPGGDPLQAALAAGEMPSPELVAASGARGTMKRSAAFGLLGALLALILGIALVDREAKLVGLVDPPLSPAVLEHRAREICAQLGYEDFADEAWGLEWNYELARVIEGNDASPDRWDFLRGDVHGTSFIFWYRRSPQLLLPNNDSSRVWSSDPPHVLNGMARVQLTASGRLMSFEAVPPVLIPGRGEAEPVDWGPVFALAGLDLALFAKGEPDRLAPVDVDERLAFVGSHPDLTDRDLKVYTGATGGRPTWFSMVWSVNLPGGGDRSVSLVMNAVYRWATDVTMLVALLGALVFGLRNLFQGRGDRRGATRVAVYIFAVGMARWTLEAHHVPDLAGETKILMRPITYHVFQAALAGFLYIALEPTVRGVWPQHLVSWTRVLRGRGRDALVGRDVLLGLAVGAGYVGLERLHYLAAGWFGAPPPLPLPADPDLMTGLRHALPDVLGEQYDAGMAALFGMFFFVLARLVLRRTSAALVLLVLIGVARMPVQVVTNVVALDLVFRVAGMLLLLTVLVRGGFLMLMAAMLALNLLQDSSFLFASGAWYGPSAAVTPLTLVALGAWATFEATRRRPG